MKYFKKISILLIALMVIGMVSCACGVNITNDNGKTINTSTAKTVDKTVQTKTIYVATNGKDSSDGLRKEKPKRTIQNAINTAKSGDTITVAPGTYKENININKNINLNGYNPEDTIIDGNHEGSCIIISNSAKVIINRFTIKDGETQREGNGGGITNNGILTLKDSTITNNIANHGGGIYNHGTLIVKYSTITDNTAYNSGGIYNNGILKIEDSAITHNIANHGGGIGNAGTVNIKDSTITDNIAKDNGGGIFNYIDSEITIINSTITDNEAKAGYGGGIDNMNKVYSDNQTRIKNNIPNNVYGNPIKDLP